MKLTSAVAVLVSLLVLAVPAAAVPYIIIDRPLNNTVVATAFTLYGAAPNADVVHVWAFPSGQPAVFLGAVAPNGVDHLRQQPSGTFSVYVAHAPLGTYPVVAYAHDPVSGTFPSQAARTLQVVACVPYLVHYLFFGPSGVLEEVPMSACGIE